ncbi:MAG TPA: DinB family protein [Candidatus Acidoferrales bacterium]|nr:DinB family protein [Candidatus Acidoferrales bacterium]
MKQAARFTLAALVLCALSFSAPAQQPKQPSGPPTFASEMNTQLGIVEHEFVSAAEAMPADKYNFAPTEGNYKGVRTFAQEVRHVATVNFAFFSAVLEQTPPPGVSANEQMNGPDSIATKDQIVQYLKDSFALGHKAMSSLTAENAVAALAKPPFSFIKTRLGYASFACTHAFDHYGQMVEYLRMNGIVPPASQGSPPANPSSAK